MNKTRNDERKQRIAEQLFELKPRISWQDREDAARAVRKSTNTVNNYLNNRVSDEVTGLEILKVLKDRIAEREKALHD